MGGIFWGDYGVEEGQTYYRDLCQRKDCATRSNDACDGTNDNCENYIPPKTRESMNLPVDLAIRGRL